MLTKTTNTKCNPRLLILIVFLLIFVTLQYTFFSPKEEEIFMVRREKTFQGMRRYDYSTAQTGTEKLIFFGLIMDQGSYGKGRTFNDYLDLIVAQDLEQATLALLISSREEFEKAAAILEDRQLPQFTRITLLSDASDAVVDRANRHANEVQMQRRRNIAVLRNTLMFSTLQNEDYSVWMDADIMEITPGTITKMIASEKDIITPGCQWGKGGGDYDMNAWKGKRTRPNDKEWEDIKQGKSSYVPRHVSGESKFVMSMKTDGVNFVPLDSVGGTLLFVKSEIFRKGVTFPVYYVIGTDWDITEGYDGIETEGLCYVARTLGYKCWGMPHDGNLMFNRSNCASAGIVLLTLIYNYCHSIIKLYYIMEYEFKTILWHCQGEHWQAETSFS